MEIPGNYAPNGLDLKLMMRQMEPILSSLLVVS